MVSISQNPIDNIIIGVIAIVFLIYVAEKVINKLIILSRKLGISQIFIGLTVISIGTSLPEITTHFVASLDILRGNINPLIASGTVLGTNVGSDIVQLNLIVGIVGLLAVAYGKAMHVKRRFLKEDFLIMIFAAVLVWLFSLDGLLSRVEGFVLFFGYMIFLWFLWIKEDERIHHHKTKVFNNNDKRHIFFDIVHIIVGLAIIVYSAEFVLRVAEFFVKQYGVGGSIIGVLVVGVATALPELTTSITAIFKGASKISIGTLIGSNITNPMLALGLGTIISTYHVPRPIVYFDLPIKILTAIILMIFLWKEKTLTRNMSMALIVIYFLYILGRMRYFPVDILI